MEKVEGESDTGLLERTGESEVEREEIRIEMSVGGGDGDS
jgi:hypothetical protein